MGHKTLMTYSLLSHLKENNKEDLSGILEIFSPIVKKALYEFALAKNLTEIKGKNISEIQLKVDEIFGIKIPISVLRIIFRQIEKELKDESSFKIYDDDAFIINSFVFTGLDSDIKEELKNIEFISADFNEFCNNNEEKVSFEEMTNFLFTLKMELFTAEGSSDFDVNYIIPKYIQQGLKNEKIRKILSDLYLGNLLTTYLEYNIKSPVTNTELLIDTNFFISLIDLNTHEAFLTCKHVLELGQKMGYRFSILYNTVEQIKILLSSRINDFASKNLGIVKEADVFGACIRRNLDKTSLERIRDNVDTMVRDFKLDFIHESRIKTIIDEAKKSDKYKELKEFRTNKLSALHDTVAYYYVKNRRGNNIREFSNVKCWFLNNSFNHDYYSNQGFKVHERIKICASELLTLLWLSNPCQDTIDVNIVAQGGLSTYIAKYKNQKIPSDKVIIAIKNRADQAVESGAITERDVFSVSVRMSEGQLTNGEAKELSKLPDEEFISSVKKYSDNKDSLNEKIRTQNEQIAKQTELLEKIIQDNQEQKLLLAIQDYEKSKSEYVEQEYVKKSIKYNNVAWLYILFAVIIISIWFVNFNYTQMITNRVATILAGLIFISSLLIRFVDHKNVLKCLRFTFLKRTRMLMKQNIITELSKQYESENIIPEKEKISNNYK